MSVLDDVKLHFVDDMEQVGKLLSWMGERRPIATLGLDTETGGFDRKRDALRLVQFGDHTHGWAIPWERWSGLVIDIVRRWLSTPGNDLTLHNSPFDRAFLKREGVEIPWGRIQDTMTMARINEPHYSMALKNQSARHVDAAAAGLQSELKDTSWTWANVPVDYQPYWSYGALDPVLTYHLRMHHEPITQREAPDAYDLEMATLAVISRMEEYGAHVDTQLAKLNYDKFMAYCKSVEQWTVEEYGIKPGSNASVIRILQEAGYTFDKATASGALALDAEVLDGIDHPLAESVLRRRQLQKLATTYLDHYITDVDENDLIHPSINTLGARTSRMSMSNPNLQNLPRGGTSVSADVVRNCVTTRYPAGSLVMCDFDQVEARLLAHCANDQDMISAFGQGDFFTNVARQIFQDPSIEKKDKRRQITKNAVYATLYGSGVRKFAQTAGIPEAQARDFMARWGQLYPGVRTFQQDIAQTAARNMEETGDPFVRSMFTRRKYVGERGKEYALTNYYIQGGAAEILKRKLVEMDRAGLGEFMVIPVHDEIICDVPPDHLEEVGQALHKIMNDATLLRVPLTASVSRGTSWGAKQDWDLTEMMSENVSV